ncbi:hypothetical protein [Snodgrassella communis]|jgi:hypothetical protein|uniref:hypothetical protein n=1 Tax=Snodgrassella communis TaxID=2946699 RepID=UPI000C1ECEAC|nr:hypothetical protein [Snodgrassella communis]PIT21395.1 hypothetical protein BGI35_05725 [Snodgrassella communis]
MRWFWKHKIVSIFLIIIITLILVSLYWLFFIFDKITDHQYGKYKFRYDYFRDDAYFEYELIDQNIYGKNKTNLDSGYYPLVKDYYIDKSAILFTYVNGDYYDGYCYYEKKLYFGKIDIINNKLYDNININLYPDVYKKLSNLNSTQRKWLDDYSNKCPKKK